jgi:hypothetical protein
VQSPTPFGALVVRAFRLCARRWWFYLAAAVVAIGLQTALLAIHSLREPIVVAVTIVMPILSLVVYVFVGTDATGQEVPRGARWERIFERSWAVIVIDVVITILLSSAIAGLSTPDATGLLIGVLAYALVMLTIYADVNAALEPKVSALWLVPNAFRRSASLALHRFNIYLTLALVATDMVVSILPQLFASWLASMHVANADFWALIPLQTLLQVPFAALVVVVYFECTGREKTAATGDRD